LPGKGMRDCEDHRTRKKELLERGGCTRKFASNKRNYDRKRETKKQERDIASQWRVRERGESKQWSIPGSTKKKRELPQ